MLGILDKAMLMAAGGGGIKFIGFTSSSSVGSTTITIDRPASVRSGDFMIAIFADPNFYTTTGPSGWVKRLTQGAAPGLDVFTKRAGASEPSNYTFTFASAATAAMAIIAFSNADYDTVGAVAVRTGVGNLVIPAITSAKGFVVAAVSSWSFGGVPTVSVPSGMTLAGSIARPSSPYDGVSVFYEQVNAGSTGSRTTTIGVSAQQIAGVLIGVKKP